MPFISTQSSVSTITADMTDLEKQFMLINAIDN